MVTLHYVILSELLLDTDINAPTYVDTDTLVRHMYMATGLLPDEELRNRDALVAWVWTLHTYARETRGCNWKPDGWKRRFK